MKSFLIFLSITALLGGCKSNGSLPMNQVFQLVQLNGKAIPDTVKATLKFQAVENGFTGNNSCNNYFGTYELQGSALTFGPTGSTKKFCAETAELEQEFMHMLDAVDNYVFENGQLRLQTGEAILAVFK